MSDVMPIGLLSRKTGVKIPTIRNYESVWLVAAAATERKQPAPLWTGRG
jgi:DNA-binding transcriptional MerR regulator